MSKGRSPVPVWQLKEELEAALASAKLPRALELALELEKREPNESRWPQKTGDILRRQKKDREAAAAFERAARCWAGQGFLARAIAMAKTVIALDPSRGGLVEELDPTVAQREHRKARPEAAPMHTPMTLEQAAPALTQAADAEEDEIRFVMEPSVVQFDLSEILTIDDDMLEALDAAEPQKAPRTIDTIAALPSFPLFAELPQEVLGKLASGSELVELQDGALVFRRDDPADALYAIVEGGVRVDVRGRPRLGEGELFGEACLSGTGRRSADVIVVGSLVALRFTKALLDQVAPSAPSLQRVLVEVLGRRVLANALAGSRLFKPLSNADRRELGLLFDMRRALPRVPLLARGKTSEALFVVMSGELEIVGADGAKRIARTGALVGERSVLNRGPSDLTATAPGGALLLHLGAARLDKFAESRPAFAAHLASIALASDAEDLDPATI